MTIAASPPGDSIAMRWTQTVLVPHPADLVLATLRDRPAEVGAQMREPCLVEVLERREQDGRIVQRTRWSTRREVPAALRRWLPDGRVSWTDESAWGHLACDWTTELHVAGAERVAIRGRDRYVDRGARLTAIENETDLAVSLALPRWVARPVEARVEALIAAILEPSVRDLFDAVRRALDRAETSITR